MSFLRISVQDISLTDIRIIKKTQTYYDYLIICKLCKMVVYLQLKKLQTLLKNFDVAKSE